MRYSQQPLAMLPAYSVPSLRRIQISLLLLSIVDEILWLNMQLAAANSSHVGNVHWKKYPIAVLGERVSMLVLGAGVQIPHKQTSLVLSYLTSLLAEHGTAMYGNIHSAYYGELAKKFSAADKPAHHLNPDCPTHGLCP